MKVCYVDWILMNRVFCSGIIRLQTTLRIDHAVGTQCADIAESYLKARMPKASNTCTGSEWCFAIGAH